MKKSLFFVAALALTFAACQPNEPAVKVADFENLEIASESIMHLNETGTFESCNFIFTQEVADYGEYGVYYFGCVPSNKTSKEYKGDYQNDMSAVGGAYKGKNFMVWTPSYNGKDGIDLKEAAVVPGMYICNTPWVVDAIKNGDGMSDQPGGFGKDDKFIVIVEGSLKGVPSNKMVAYTLAEGSTIVDTWEYFPLHELGTVDHLSFRLTSTKTNAQGMTTPAYFCIDNLGAQK